MAQSVPVSTIAKLLNLTERRVQQLAKEGVIPKALRGEYNLVGCVQGYIRYLQEEARQGGGGDDELKLHKTRMLAAKANIAELEAKERFGELVPADEVSEAWGQMVANMRARLLSMPGKLAPQLVGIEEAHEAQTLIKTAVFEALQQLATPDIDGPSDDSDPRGKHQPSPHATA